MEANLIMRGNKKINFEFKLLDNGNLAFIKYHDGDREGSPTYHVFTGLVDNKTEKMQMINARLKTVAGVSFKMLKKVHDLFN